jgi:hypothetical protein
LALLPFLSPRRTRLPYSTEVLPLSRNDGDTPFSGQALDRGLSGRLLSMIRHGVAEMEPPTGVMNLHEQRPAAEALLAWMVGRARRQELYLEANAIGDIARIIVRCANCRYSTAMSKATALPYHSGGG